ncbi:MAG: hypothetical protein JNL70_01350, partial [Saprospiraceae bacterium]|nr:hypothetical protein [Saprospiraceae bacterium]
MNKLIPFKNLIGLWLLVVSWCHTATIAAQNISTILKSTSNTSTDNAYGRGVATDASNNVYVVGNFVGSVSFGSNTLTSAGGADIFIAKYDNTGAFQWARRAGGTGDDQVNGIALSSSDIYIAGQIGTTTVNFNTPSATGSNEITSAGSNDIFVAKFDNTGAFQWAKRAGGTGDDIANGVAVSGTEVYIVGRIGVNVANFNTPSATGSNEITSAGSNDIFVAKYDNTGVLQWVKRAGGTTSDTGYGIAVSGTEVYITGNISSTANFNTPSNGSSNTIASGGSNDVFVAKFDNAGIFQWARRAGGTGVDNASGIAVSGTGVYITGYIDVNTVNFNTPSNGSSNTITSAGSYDMFVAKFNSSGTFQWAKRAGGTGSDVGNNIAASGTDIYVVGNINGTANFNTPSATGSNEIISAGNADVYVAKYDDTGMLQWVKRGGGTGSDQGFGVAATTTHVFITGSFVGTANFNTPSASGSNELSSVSASNDMFLVSYNAVVLPVELISFEGIYIDPKDSFGKGGNLLTWTTANETNNKGFEVERQAATANEWETLGFVAAQGKAATYQFLDNTPTSSSLTLSTTVRFQTSPSLITSPTLVNYYRLRQIDNDGTETLSKAIAIQVQGSKDKLKAYPSVTHSILTIETDA